MAPADLRYTLEPCRRRFPTAFRSSLPRRASFGLSGLLSPFFQELGKLMGRCCMLKPAMLDSLSVVDGPLHCLVSMETCWQLLTVGRQSGLLAYMLLSFGGC